MAIKKVSYGYSGTITNHEQQLQALEYIEKGIEVFILSSRDTPEGMYLIADHLGIPHENVFATGDNDKKIQQIEELEVDIHYDTNPYVIENLGDKAVTVEPAKMTNVDIRYIAV